MTPIPPEFATQAHDLGRTYDLLGCVPIVHLQCRCDRRVPLILNGCPSTVSCSSCGRTFVMDAVTCEGHLVGARIVAREHTVAVIQ